MPTIQIADKTTLDAVKIDTTNILARGGAKSDGNGGLLVWNPSTSSWDTVSAGGGSNPIITVPNRDMEWTGEDVTITDVNSGWTTTIVMPDTASVSVEVPYIRTNYVVSITSAFDYEIEINSVGNFIANNAKIASFSTGTDKDIKTMLDAYYADQITWAEMGWAVGDTRTIHLNSMTPPNGSDASTWVAQDIVVTIVAHDHTDLATAINGHTKACITVQTREVLSGTSAGTRGIIYVNGDSSYDKSFTKWSNLYMRTYLNSTVLGAIPSGDFKSAIKQSKHYRHTTYNGTASEQVTDTLFLPSYPEIYGTASYSSYVATSPVEGTQFSYYAIASNRIKYPNNNGSAGSTANPWWEGSASATYTSSYRYSWCRVGADGTAGSNTGATASGLAPAFAM